jgi:hypothetical protein
MIASTIRNTSTTNNAGFPRTPEAHQRAVVQAARGQAIRAHYAQAVAALAADSSDADAQLGLDVALLEAGFLGHSEWLHSECRIPQAFADEPRLLNARQLGQDKASLEFLAAN